MDSQACHIIVVSVVTTFGQLHETERLHYGRCADREDNDLHRAETINRMSHDSSIIKIIVH